MSNEITDLTVKVYAQTEKALQVSIDEDTKVWLPRSQIEHLGEAEESGLVDLSIPEWLALEKGLI